MEEGGEGEEEKGIRGKGGVFLLFLTLILSPQLENNKVTDKFSQMWPNKLQKLLKNTLIFTVRQLVEKSWEHAANSYLTFIDLKKSYNSVPREAMWLAVKKLGVPAEGIQLIHSFHMGMKAKIASMDIV